MLKAPTFVNSYAELPAHFFSRLAPTPVSQPEIILLNENLAKDLDLDIDFLRSKSGVAMLAGNQVPPGADPLAMVYAGHQFGGWVPQLGDGRALLLGEVCSANGKRFDIQLKGSGPTPYSRQGDGRAWLGPVLREYIVSEAMAAFSIPTTRALAALATGETVLRESALPGAILARVALGHIRVGTFEYFAARRDVNALRILADYVLQRQYPEIIDSQNPYDMLLEAVMRRQARLVAQWQGVGFIHGVMNTDNMSISGETIDYGPCAFMDIYDPNQVFSSIDQMGRYAYRNQPGIAQWNLAMLAQSLLPLMDDDSDAALERAQDMINQYPDIYTEQYLRVMRAKLGLTQAQDDDTALIEDLLNIMHEQKLDFTNTFRLLVDLFDRDQMAEKVQVPSGQNVLQTESFQNWMGRWHERLANEESGRALQSELMQSSNPVYIPRNHQVERVIKAALEDDFAPLHKLHRILTEPFTEQVQAQEYTRLPGDDEVVRYTFCGT